MKRHSLSLRSPPFKSIAYDIINTPKMTEPKINLARTSSLVEEVRSITETLSDFASCYSSTEDEIHDGKVEDENGFLLVSDKKRNKKLKRKAISPRDKVQLSKKPNLVEDKA